MPGSLEEHRKSWAYPSGTCILCQEETNDTRLYGTFALIMDSDILRQTDLKDPSFVGEALDTPDSLDRSAEEIRPFGVSGQNRRTVRKLTNDGQEVITERQGLGKGFPPCQVKRGPITVGCGHYALYVL
jgi:E3 ubiquitin-protein ligase UBR1